MATERKVQGNHRVTGNQTIDGNITLGGTLFYLELPDGSLTAPALAFADDSNTGIKHHDSDEDHVELVAGGVVCGGYKNTAIYGRQLIAPASGQGSTPGAPALTFLGLNTGLSYTSILPQDVALVIASAPVLQIDADGRLAFFGGSLYSQPSYTAMSGTADRTTAYDTATITTEELAERVKAMEDDLMGFSLFG